MDTAKEYIEKGGNSCPHCSSGDITGGYIEADNHIAWRNVECEECGENWREEFTMTNVDFNV